jgi:hypothetical protein
VNYIQIAEDALRDEVAATGHHVTGTQARLYTLLVLTKGTETTLADVHDAWAISRNLNGTHHPCLIPFGELSDDIVEWDAPFLAAIHAATKRLASRAR